MSASLFSETRRRCIERGFEKYPDARTLFQQFFLDARGTRLENEIEILTGLYLVWMDVKPGYIYEKRYNDSVELYFTYVDLIEEVYGKKYGFKRYNDLGSDGCSTVRVLFSIHDVDKPSADWTEQDIADFLGYHCRGFPPRNKHHTAFNYGLYIPGLNCINLYTELCSGENQCGEYALSKRELFDDTIKLVNPEWSIGLGSYVIEPQLPLFKNSLRLLVNGDMTIDDADALIREAWGSGITFLPQFVESGKHTIQDLLDNKDILIYVNLLMILTEIRGPSGVVGVNSGLSVEETEVVEKIRNHYFSDINVDPRISDDKFANDKFFDDICKRGILCDAAALVAWTNAFILRYWFGLYKDGANISEIIDIIDRFDDDFHGEFINLMENCGN